VEERGVGSKFLMRKSVNGFLSTIYNRMERECHGDYPACCDIVNVGIRSRDVSEKVGSPCNTVDES